MGPRVTLRVQPSAAMPRTVDLPTNVSLKLAPNWNHSADDTRRPEELSSRTEKPLAFAEYASS